MNWSNPAVKTDYIYNFKFEFNTQKYQLGQVGAFEYMLFCLNGDHPPINRFNDTVWVSNPVEIQRKFTEEEAAKLFFDFFKIRVKEFL